MKSQAIMQSLKLVLILREDCLADLSFIYKETPFSNIYPQALLDVIYLVIKYRIYHPFDYNIYGL